MTLLAPWWLAAGATVALGLVALHLLATGRPTPMAWPTARFVPARAAQARRLARRPADRLLLATRVAAVLLAALALARPLRTPARRPVARVVLADVSRAARDAGAVRDSVRALAGAGDLLIAFDTTAAPPVLLGASTAERDSVVAATLATRDAAAAPAAGSLSAALAAARRAAPRLRDAADSVELVLVSTLVAREADAATRALRGAWAGRARLVPVAAAGDARTPDGVQVVARRGGPADDALAAAASLLGRGGRGARRNAPGRVGMVRGESTSGAMLEVGGGGPEDLRSGTTTAAALATPASGRTAVRIVRDRPTPADSAWVRDSGGVLVDWPLDGVPAGWRRAARVDTAGAVVARGAVFVAAMTRRAAWPATGETVVARWADGEPAATERAIGAVGNAASGCVRAVAVPVPQVGDAALRPPFLAFLAALAGPCAHHASGGPLDSATVRVLAGQGPLLAAATLAAPKAARDPLATWLLAAALALLVAELPLRRVGRRRDDAAVADDAAGTVGAAPEAAA